MMINFVPIFMLFLCRHCYADTNEHGGSICWPSSEAKSSSAWTENVNTLFTKLEANVILNNGYYRAEAGEKGPDRVYGLIQCRGDISKSNCANCTRESFILSANSSACGGAGNKGVLIWQSWCLLRYSNASFYGTWEKSSLTVYRSNSSSLGEPAAAAKGRTMLLGLAAAAPGESLMFATGEVDVDGLGGKRYGLGQCTRDLGKSECRDCLEWLVKAFGTTVSDDRSCQINGVGCFMLYDNTRFYFNLTAEEGLGKPAPPKSNASNRGLAGRLSMAITIFMTTMAFL
ncbi:PREDICTED: cysteine-rich repeat secretory protein 38-like [Erythranthe guttata]|uniref:cysteine-rich repeat secretory protein 38-like n=1 Tax=Erythranthe guttata TaxID=4155 RepID=UPI00064D74C2|nr:PREDICTED: cysteine-rich repeat secretory protein 38-like [Erythranthe guttata]|eukprot:XP_012848432.1 PREDICTED: cysteine-rich repeat secretory protein 38-like [Erythranthe guttata]